MHIPAKVDYALRALLVLAAADGERLTAEEIATDQELPVKFLESILTELRRAGFVVSQRGAEGGYRLARPAREITVAEVMRDLDGPLAVVRGLRPEHAEYAGAAEHLQSVWIALRASVRSVLDRVTLADIAAGAFPKPIAKMVADPEAWQAKARP